jgi:hypothetical protein
LHLSGKETELAASRRPSVLNSFRKRDRHRKAAAERLPEKVTETKSETRSMTESRKREKEAEKKMHCIDA